MSRRLSRPVDVQCDSAGTPVSIIADRSPLPVCTIIDDWREWFGAVFGEPERDVWVVETPAGVYELHCVRYPSSDASEQALGQWLLERAED